MGEEVLKVLMQEEGTLYTFNFSANTKLLKQ